MHGFEPLLLDLEAVRDTDHVLAIYRYDGHWGAIAKSNWAGLRFREPVYRSLRELAMSYFEDYYNLLGERTLRAFSRPVKLKRFDYLDWMTTEKPVWFIAEHLCHISHTPLITAAQEKRLSRLDARSHKAGLFGYEKALKVYPCCASSMEPNINPSEEYSRRLAARNAQATRFDRRSAEISNLRLSTFLILIALVWLAFRHTVHPAWIALPVAVFIALLAVHDRVLQRLTSAQRAAEIYERGLARIEDRWQRFGRTGEQFRDPDHVYAEDLDLFGPGGLFQLLSTARTRMGEETLARWLLQPAPLAVIQARQQAVSELRGRLDLREDLAVCGEQVQPEYEVARLLEWAEGPELLHSARIRVLAALLALLATAGAVIAVWKQEYIPLAAVILVESVILLHYRKRVETVMESVEGAGEALLLFSTLLKRIERERFSSPLLTQLHAQLDSGEGAASRALKKFSDLVDLVDSRDNLILRVLNVPVLYELQVAFAVETWRRRHGRQIRAWLEVVGEMEALASLATYSYEHPADPFPEFVDQPAAEFAGRSLGHPLIPSSRNVRNSVKLDPTIRVVLVSGSNMSGKSTYLRTIGLTAVLAMAGAPVRAEELRLTPVQIGSSLHVIDSLQSGRSGFASELHRLRQIMNMMNGQLPVLFLVDELLHGTNSRDRHVGGEALLKAFVMRGSIGVATTHDLSLTNVPLDLKPHVRNAHFEDRVEDGRMIFDYILRDGVVTKSNALELMRSIGLDV